MRKSSNRTRRLQASSKFPKTDVNQISKTLHVAQNSSKLEFENDDDIQNDDHPKCSNHFELKIVNESMKQNNNSNEKLETQTTFIQLTMLEERSSRVIQREISHTEVTVMLIAMVLFFVILQTPAVVCNCVYGIKNFDQMFQKDTTGINMVCNVGNFFILTCSSMPFFTYCTFNKRFRRTLVVCVKRLFWCFKSSKHNQSNHSSQQIILHQVCSNYYKNKHFYSGITQSRLHRLRLRGV